MPNLKTTTVLNAIPTSLSDYSSYYIINESHIYYQDGTNTTICRKLSDVGFNTDSVWGAVVPDYKAQYDSTGILRNILFTNSGEFFYLINPELLQETSQIVDYEDFVHFRINGLQYDLKLMDDTTIASVVNEYDFIRIQENIYYSSDSTLYKVNIFDGDTTTWIFPENISGIFTFFRNGIHGPIIELANKLFLCFNDGTVIKRYLHNYTSSKPIYNKSNLFIYNDNIYFGDTTTIYNPIVRISDNGFVIYNNYYINYPFVEKDISLLYDSTETNFLVLNKEDIALVYYNTLSGYKVFENSIAIDPHNGVNVIEFMYRENSNSYADLLFPNLLLSDLTEFDVDNSFILFVDGTITDFNHSLTGFVYPEQNIYKEYSTPAAEHIIIASKTLQIAVDEQYKIQDATGYITIDTSTTWHYGDSTLSMNEINTFDFTDFLGTEITITNQSATPFTIISKNNYKPIDTTTYNLNSNLYSFYTEISLLSLSNELGYDLNLELITTAPSYLNVNKTINKSIFVLSKDFNISDSTASNLLSGKIHHDLTSSSSGSVIFQNNQLDIDQTVKHDPGTFVGIFPNLTPFTALTYFIKRVYSPITGISIEPILKIGDFLEIKQSDPLFDKNINNISIVNFNNNYYILVNGICVDIKKTITNFDIKYKYYGSREYSYILTGVEVI